MSDAEPRPRSAEVIAFPRHAAVGGARVSASSTVRFDRAELDAILDLYRRRVAAGSWRDYTMDFLQDRALFSIHARAAQRPIFIIEKNPALHHTPAHHLLFGPDGRVLKRGHTLDVLLRVLEFAVVG